MSQNESWAHEPKYEHNTAVQCECDHGFFYLNENGCLYGSWSKARVGRFIRISCCICGKLYGYIPPPEDPRRNNIKHKRSS
jgi:hypothetical protein